MTDTTTSGAEKAKEQIAKHELIAVPGGEHTDMQTAVGIRYTDKASGKVFEYMIPGAKAGDPLTMLALFGAKTKATNETSRARQSGRDSADEQLEALDETFDSISQGVWREKAEGGGGSRTDKGLLAQVFVEMLGQAAKGDAAYYVAKFEADLPYMRKVLASEAGTAYRKRVGKAPASAASLA